MKCSPLFLTSPTGVWKESFRLWLNKQNIQEPLSCLNPLSGKESFRPKYAGTIVVFVNKLVLIP